MALTGRKPSSDGGNSSTSSTKKPSASGGGTGGKPGARGKSRRGNASADGGTGASQQKVGKIHAATLRSARTMSRRICVLLRQAGLSTPRIREVMLFVRQKDGKDEANQYFVLPKPSNDVSSGGSCLSPEEYRAASQLPGFSEFWASLKVSAKTLLDGKAVRILKDNDQSIDKFWPIMSRETSGHGSKQKQCYFLLDPKEGADLVAQCALHLSTAPNQIPSAHGGQSPQGAASLCSMDDQTLQSALQRAGQEFHRLHTMQGLFKP